MPVDIVVGEHDQVEREIVLRPLFSRLLPLAAANRGAGGGSSPPAGGAPGHRGLLRAHGRGRCVANLQIGGEPLSGLSPTSIVVTALGSEGALSQQKTGRPESFEPDKPAATGRVGSTPTGSASACRMSGK